MVYARRVFDPSTMSTDHRNYSFLRTALDLVEEEKLYRSIAEELLKKAKFVPVATIHESRLNFSATLYHVLADATYGFLAHRAQSQVLTEEECQPLLSTAQVSLLSEFELDLQKSRQVTR